MTIEPVTAFPFETSQDVAVTTWADMAADDVGGHVRLAVYSDRSVQVAGTFGGASVTIAGSNDGVEWHALNDAQGEPMTVITGVLKTVVELPVFVKPRVFGGDGTTNLRVILAGRLSIR